MTHKKGYHVLLAAILALSGQTASATRGLKSVALKRTVAQEKEERELENTLPKHLPIRVKLKAEKEKAFKDLDNTDWARDFELEVKNTGTKPIYQLVLLLLLPETQIAGGRLLFSLHYGRTELSVFKEKLELAKPEDIPIQPGETYIFKIPQGQDAGWEDLVRAEGWPQPKRVVLKLEGLSFGDGTGFRWNEGIPWPQPPGWNKKK